MWQLSSLAVCPLSAKRVLRNFCQVLDHMHLIPLDHGMSAGHPAKLFMAAEVYAVSARYVQCHSQLEPAAIIIGLSQWFAFVSLFSFTYRRISWFPHTIRLSMAPSLGSDFDCLSLCGQPTFLLPKGTDNRFFSTHCFTAQLKAVVKLSGG